MTMYSWRLVPTSRVTSHSDQWEHHVSREAAEKFQGHLLTLPGWPYACWCSGWAKQRWLGLLGRSPAAVERKDKEAQRLAAFLCSPPQSHWHTNACEQHSHFCLDDFAILVPLWQTVRAGCSWVLRQVIKNCHETRSPRRSMLRPAWLQLGPPGMAHVHLLVLLWLFDQEHGHRGLFTPFSVETKSLLVSSAANSISHLLSCWVRGPEGLYISSVPL